MRIINNVPRSNTSEVTTNVMVPDDICLPADGIYAGWYERPNGDVQQGIEEQDQAGSPGVHHARRFEDGELLRRALEGGVGRRPASLQHLDQPPTSGARRFRPRLHDRENGPLHRPHDGGVGARRGPGKGVDHGVPITVVTSPEGIGDAPQDLRQDHP